MCQQFHCRLTLSPMGFVSQFVGIQKTHQMMGTLPLEPKPLDYYADLTAGGALSLTLEQDEACVALKVYDYGHAALTEEEELAFRRLIGKLKDQLWP